MGRGLWAPLPLQVCLAWDLNFLLWGCRCVHTNWGGEPNHASEPPWEGMGSQGTELISVLINAAGTPIQDNLVLLRLFR